MSAAENLDISDSHQSDQPLRIMIVAENASAQYGGEAILPLQYFRLLRDRGAVVWLITHARVRAELTALLPHDQHRIIYIRDSVWHRVLWSVGAPLPTRVRYLTTEFLSRLTTQYAQRSQIKRLIAEHGIHVVHQPTPVSPREPSLLFGLGASVVIGPMNGGMDPPPAFRSYEPLRVRAFVATGRKVAHALGYVMRGKRDAAVLLVANQRTRTALRADSTKHVVELPENAVDLQQWRNAVPRLDILDKTETTRFAFVGRLVMFKGVELWLEAFAAAAKHSNVSGLVIGDGVCRDALVDQARAAGILASHPNERGKVYFAGWRPHAEVAELLATQHCLVMPSLIDCGGAVILEAMALGRPVIATKWGGALDYLDESCGIMVSVDSKEATIEGLAQAMLRLASDARLCEVMGQAGRRRIEERFSWDHKIESVMKIYESVAQHARADSRQRLRSVKRRLSRSRRVMKWSRLAVAGILCCL